MKKYIAIGFLIFLIPSFLMAQISIPRVHTNMGVEGERMYMEINGERFYQKERAPRYTLEQMRGRPSGTDDGLAFDFGEGLQGTLYYGLIDYGDSKHPSPVYFRRTAAIEKGRAHIPIKGNLDGRYDMVGWEKSGKGVLGYRVVNHEGRILYDGKIGFKGHGPFEVDDTIIEGPFVHLLRPFGATISFDTNRPIVAHVLVNGQTVSGTKPQTHHELPIDGLEPNTSYSYTIRYGENEQSYRFKTAPRPGSRTAFSFSYASDSRSGQGGGERDLFGTNFYVMRKMMALNSQEGVAFAQFTGDMINGYLSNRGEMDLQYANWKRSFESYAHYFPVIPAMGNHEAFVHVFDDGSRYGLSVDRFPYASESAEKVFADHFVNPHNGPVSEDGAVYDPDPETMDFPSYKENAYFYIYDNVAVIVMNSDYWYSPSRKSIPHVGGGIHGYIMDQQLAWFKKTLFELEANPDIDHIFVTEHTPFFPNGGHSGDDMWYRGNNDIRPFVAGQPLKYGIIERRDQLLDLIVNKSKKVVAILTGDEHNYNKLEIGPKTPIYPENWPNDKKLTLKRTVYQINNGAAGAPYYAQEKLPWSAFVSGFSTQNALVIFKVRGRRIKMVVKNPDTLEKVDELQLR